MPVVVLSAHTGRSMEAEVFQRGASHYLVKNDVGLKEIVKLAKDVLQQRVGA